MGDDDIDLQPDEVGSQWAEPFVFAVGPTVLDGQIATLGVPEVTQSLSHGFDVGRVLQSRGGTQEADSIHLPGRLRLGGERRPKHQSTEECAPVHYWIT